MTLLTQIEAFCHRNRMTETRFGKSALNDPSFVHELRRGRDVKLSTAERVQAWMADNEGGGNAVAG